MLMHALKDLQIVSGWSKYSSLASWASMLGAAVAQDQARLSFVETCITCQNTIRAQCAPFKNNSAEDGTWEQAIDICHDFLWYAGSETPLQQEMISVKKAFETIRVNDTLFKQEPSLLTFDFDNSDWFGPT